MDYAKAADRYREELLASVIPFWERHAIDAECGGYFTFLDRDGTVYDTEKFLWMQWRIVYMFATLAAEPFGEARWIEIARRGYDFLVAHGKDASGHYHFALNRAGEPSVAPYSIYSDCFAAMGAAALFRVTGEPAHRQEAESAMANYRRRMDDPKGRWEKRLAGKPAYQGLGHYMMLANLGRELNAALETDRYTADIRTAAATVLDRFWHAEYGVLFENVPKAGGFDLATCEGRHINPGHGLEAMWFLLDWALEAGEADVIARACRAVQGLLAFGWDAEHGGIFYFMDVCGRPHVELQADMKLWWVHNEAILAALYALEASGDPAFAAWFERLDAWTWERFPDPEHGEWFGYLNRRGEPTHALKGGRWKTFFHLPRMLLVGSRRLGALAAAQT